MSFLDVQSLCVSYGTRQVINDICFTCSEGSITGLLGENGCGKTTLIRAVCGALPHSGTCMLDGQRLEAMNARQIGRICSYIPQRSGISIDLSLLDVVLMGFNPHLGLLESPTAAMRDRAMQALKAVGLQDRANESYLTLSVGQKQLCILARTLVSEGKLLLLDEPESALDFSRRSFLLDHIRQWIGNERRCALVALHDPQLALNRCDCLLLMHNGKVLAEIHPKTDDLADMESALSAIYGPVTLAKCRDKNSNEHLVMLKED